MFCSLGSKDSSVKANHRTTAMYGLCEHLVRSDVQRFIKDLIARKFLCEDTIVNKQKVYASYSYVRLGERASDITLRGLKYNFSICVKSKKE